MSFETPTPDAEVVTDRSEEAMEAARDLIAENPILSGDTRVQRIAENDFVTEAGQEVDPGNWIAGMLDKLIELGENGSEVVAISDAEFEAQIARNMAIGSKDRVVFINEDGTREAA